MKKCIYCLFYITILFSCKKLGTTQLNSASESKIYTIAEINRKIETDLQKTGTFNWNEENNDLLYSAIIHGDSLLLVGYGNKSVNSGVNTRGNNTSEDISNISIEAAKKVGINTNLIKNSILDMVRIDEGIKRSNATTETYNVNTNVLKYESSKLTTMVIKIGNLKTLTNLRKSASVRYLEPIGYGKNLIKSDINPITRSSIFGGQTTSSPVLDPSFFSQEKDGPFISKSYKDQKIDLAWKITTGKNITVGLIDNGIFKSQTILSSPDKFDINGTGRTITNYGTYKTLWNWVSFSAVSDGEYGQHSKLLSGHGTSMASIIAAPKQANMPVGVAYNCNLISYRATDMPFLLSWPRLEGVADAFVKLADNANVKIISFSGGTLFYSYIVADAIKYAKSKGKLIFVAAGTTLRPINAVLFTIDIPSIIGVTFPAQMNEVVAVTGTNYKGDHLTKCAECSMGSKVYFTATTSIGYNENRAVLSLQPTDGLYDFTASSSAATAINAGIAALVWSAHPTWTDKQVLERMVQSAKFYPVKDQNLGYGPVNVIKAVK